MANDSALHIIRQMIAKLESAEDLAAVRDALRERRDLLDSTMKRQMTVGTTVELRIRGVKSIGVVEKINRTRVIVAVGPKKWSCSPGMLSIIETKPTTPASYDASTDAVIWKDEGTSGPLWVRQGGKLRNYQDGVGKNFDGAPLPVWFTREQARTIASILVLPFEEV